MSRSHLVPLDGGQTRVRVDRVAAELPASAWQRRSARAGSKGPRFYDWAWLDDVCTDADPDDAGHHSLLIRRNNTTGVLAFYRCCAPRTLDYPGPPRAGRGHPPDGRGRLPERQGQVGLDQHQVRRWDSWHRFAPRPGRLAVLAICAADAATNETDNDPGHTGLIKLTVNEVRRLINIFIIRPINDLAHRLHWSNWRRRHQARARQAHYTRRLNLELQP